MLQSLWNEYGNEALIALGGAFATALIMRLKAWQLGDLDNDAPFVRQFLAYAAGYAAALAAVRTARGACPLCSDHRCRVPGARRRPSTAARR